MWREEYGVAKFDLEIVTISVFYAMDGKGYRYSYGNVRSKKLYPTMGEAKEAALIRVSKRLEEAQRKIIEARELR